METTGTVLEGDVTPRTIKVGEIMGNHAVVLAVKPYQHDPKGIVVLALWRDEFATWVSSPDGTEAFWGHYFLSDLRAAMADYEAR